MMRKEANAEDGQEIRDTLKFFEAACDAAKRSDVLCEFKCPLCEGKAGAIRSSYNNHVRAQCEDCKYTVMQ